MALSGQVGFILLDAPALLFMRRPLIFKFDPAPAGPLPLNLIRLRRPPTLKFFDSFLQVLARAR